MSQYREPVMIVAPPLKWLSCPHARLASPTRKVVQLEIIFGLHESLELIEFLVRPTSKWQSWRLYIVRPSPLAIVSRRANCLLDGFDPATPLAPVPLEPSHLVAGMQEHWKAIRRRGIAKLIVLVELFPSKIHTSEEVLTQRLALQIFELRK